MRYQTSYGFDSFGMGLSLTLMVKRLLIANVVVFAVQLILPAFVFDWFAFQPGEVVFKPWGFVTYTFLHGGAWHLFGNMLFLFFFGPPLEARWGAQEFLKYYLICGFGGALLSFAFMPDSIIGASAAVYGVMLAFAMNWPEAPIYVFGIFPVQARYLVAFLGVVALLSAADSTTGGGGVAHLAHLGGLAAGWIYLKADFRRGRALEGLRRSVGRRRHMAAVHGEGDQDAPPRAARKRRGAVVREDSALYDRVDAVLDKISAEGMASLTEAELALLDEVSRKHRTN